MKKNSSDRPAPKPLHPALKNVIGILLVEAGNRSRDLFTQHLAELGLGFNHFRILWLLVHDGPQSQSELAHHLEVDRALMVHLIDHIEKLELVERAPNPRDRRAYAITLTPKGQELLTQAIAMGKSTEAEFLAPLSAQERQQLKRLLLRLLEEEVDD